MSTIYSIFGPRIQTVPVDAPVDPLPSGEKEKFFKACKDGDLKAVQEWCLNFPGSVNVKDQNGQTGLMVAALARKIDVAIYLVKNCPNYDINAEDKDLRNALFHACMANDGKIGILLIENHIRIIIDITSQYPFGVFKTKSPNGALLKRLTSAVSTQELLENQLMISLKKKFVGKAGSFTQLTEEGEKKTGRKFLQVTLEEYQTKYAKSIPKFENMPTLNSPLQNTRDPVTSELKVGVDNVKKELLLLDSRDTQLRVKKFVKEHPNLAAATMCNAFKEATGVKIQKSIMQKYINLYGSKSDSKQIEETVD